MEITLEQVLKIGVLKNAAILAGKEGLKNKITGVTVLEVSDLSEEGSSLLNLKPGEIVITSCNDIKNDVEKQIHLMQELQQKQVAGVILFYLGYVIKRLDARIIGICDKLEIPLICPPNETQVSYAAVMNDIISLLMRKSDKDSKKEREILKRIMELNQKQEPFTESMEILGEAYDVSLMLLEESLEEIYACGSDVSKMREYLKTEDFMYRKKTAVYLITDDKRRFIWKKIWHKNMYLWLGCYCKTGQCFQTGFVFQSFEMIIDIWEKDIFHKSQHTLILSILKGDYALASSIAEKQKIDLESVVGMICIEKENHFERDQQMKSLLHTVIQEGGCQAVFAELQQVFVYVLWNCYDKRISDIKESILYKRSFQRQMIVAPLFGKEDLFLFFPKAVAAFSQLKGIKVNKVYDRNEVQSFLQMQGLLRSPMKGLLENMEGILTAYDKKNKSNLKKMVVECCLEYKMNLKEMAKREFIHYNTVQYRMKKVEEILQINLKEPADISQLYLLALSIRMTAKE